MLLKEKNTAMLWLRVHLEGHVIFDVIITQLIQKSHPALEKKSNAGPTIYISCQSNMQKRYLLPKVASRSIVRMRKNFLVLLLCLSFVRCESRRVTDYGDYLVQDYGK